MPEDTIESLAARMAELERKLAEASRPKDWRAVVGVLPDDEFTRAWAAAVAADREAERAAARANPSEDDL